MKVRTAIFTPFDAPIIVALVDSRYTRAAEGEALVERLGRHFRTAPIMLVSIEPNGYRAYATFQTHVLLALLQLEVLHFDEVDLDETPLEEDCVPF
jgi:hypothetical protein